MRTPLLAALILASVTLQGCLARAAVDVVTLPVRAVSAGVDAATTSQSEADEARGRDIRRREERLAKLERDYHAQRDDCATGDDNACEKARETYDAMQDLLPTIPVEPDH